jgi:hypothetical protein
MPAAVVVIGLDRWAWQRNASSSTRSEPTHSHCPLACSLDERARMPGGRIGSP